MGPVILPSAERIGAHIEHSYYIPYFIYYGKEKQEKN